MLCTTEITMKFHCNVFMDNIKENTVTQKSHMSAADAKCVKQV